MLFNYKKKSGSLLLTLFIGIILLLTSCAENKKENFDVKQVENNFMKWWTYQSNEIKLSSDFIPLDTKSKQIDKKVFLKTLLSGNYIPVKLKPKRLGNRYKLVMLSENSQEDIRKTIKNQAAIALKNYEMENKKFPKFDFIDLNGLKYNNENTKNKVVILKCWFINCKACVEEFPKLNSFYDEKKEANNIVFISIALDTKEKLIPFLKDHPFNYPVITNQKEFLNKTLNIDVYPTHFFIDEKGIIKKVVNNVDELIEFVDAKNHILDSDNEQMISKQLPPPPPIK